MIYLSDVMKIKEKPRDFVVEEITPDGLILEVGKEWKFEESEGKHLICVLEKVNWDTNRAVKMVSKQLHVSPKRVGFAGTKDKRAWTAQRISIWGLGQDDITKVHLKDLKLWPIKRSNERIKLGDLWGNRFTITIRELDNEEKAKLEKPREFKVPNFFGIQRFGEKRPVTHLVGKALVLGNPELAVKLYLGWVGPGEREETKEARRKVKQNWDWNEALNYFPKHLSYERTLISHLSNHTNDYVGALRKLPKNLLKMFVHGYQSYLFNRYLEERINKHGFGGLEGDVLENDVPTGPIYGYETQFPLGEEGELEKQVIKQEGVWIDQFRIKSIPEASSKGMRRGIFVTVHDYQVIEEGSDWVRIRFKLEKGTYATTVLDYIFGIKHKIPDTKNLWADDDTQGS